jgi:hypothetical protein
LKDIDGFNDFVFMPVKVDPTIFAVKNYSMDIEL